MPRLLALLLLLCCTAVAAAPVAPDALPPSQAERIERERAGLDQAGLDEAHRREAEGALGAADAAERVAAEQLEQARALREAAALAAGERAALQARLAQAGEDHAAWQRRLPDSPDPEAFEPLLANERGEAMRLRTELQQVLSTLAAFTTPSVEGGADDSERQLRIDELERRLAATTAGPDLPPAAASARRVRLRAELRAERAEQFRRAVERETAPIRREHLELRQRVLQRELGERERRVERLQAMIAERSDSHVGELLEQLTAIRAEHPPESALHQQAERSIALASELQTLHQRLGALRREMREAEQQRDRVAAARRNTEARLALDSGSDALGLILLAERRQLGSPDVLGRRLEALQRELARMRLRQIDLAQQRMTYDGVADACRIDAVVDDLDGPQQPLAHSAALLSLREACSGLLPRLDTALDRYIAALDQGEATLKPLHEQTRQLRDMLDRRLFWIPSHAPVDLRWLQRVPAGWVDLLKPSRIATSIEKLQQRIVDAPLFTLFGVLVVAGLLRMRMRAHERIAAFAPPLRNVAADRYRLTAHALLHTVLAALPWPLLTWLLGYSLRNAGAAGRYSDSLGRAFIVLAGGVLLWQLLRWLIIERGLAHLHFRWTRTRRDSIRRALPWIALILLPMQFCAALAFARGVDLAVDTAGRISLAVFAATTAVLLWRMLAPGELWTPRGGAPEPQRQRQLLHVALPAALAAITLGLFAGYLYSGWLLMICLWQSLWAVLGIALVHGLLARWFLLGERRLAHQRLQAQREASAAEASSEGDDGAVEVAAPEMTLEQVNAQTSRLLRATTLSLWVGALFFIWSDVLPALGRLDDIALWTYTSLAEDGSTVIDAVTLRAALFGLLVLVLTFVVARNLPGLIEIGLLSRISLVDASTRYAIASVSRYVIVIAGSMFGLAMLGLRWSQLQWMAAALSVGLGFGLQEIFANFVSGLILLFERPFRVGDVITIREYTGTVSRIRTRATTLIDFDNKEIVVPNKNFITERLINWTLSDTRTRIILKVGVAYGTDPARVHALLQQAAAEHPLVLAEPAPRSWFLAFGASSLDFELRVFVEALSDRMPVTSELNARIATLFNEAGIEIAFPQLDLHVRDVCPPALSVASPAEPRPS